MKRRKAVVGGLSFLLVPVPPKSIYTHVSIKHSRMR
jgi:hypothetical protein